LFKNVKGFLTLSGHECIAVKKVDHIGKDSVKLSFLSLPLIFILPGFDKRFGWPEIPVYIEIIALALVLIGYLMTIPVLKANSYASRVVEVDKSQKIISTGPFK